MTDTDRSELWERAGSTDAHERFAALTELLVSFHESDDNEQELLVAVAALDAARELDDETLGNALDNLALAQWEAELFIESAANYVEAADTYASIELWQRAGTAWMRAALSLLDAGERDLVMRHVARGSEALRRADVPEHHAIGLLRIAQRMAEESNHDDAITLILQAQAIAHEIGDAHIARHVDTHLVHAYGEAGQLDRLQTHLDAGVATARQAGDLEDLALIEFAGCRALAIHDRRDIAMPRLMAVLDEMRGQVANERLADLLRLRSQMLTAEQCYAEELDALDDALHYVASADEVDQEARRELLYERVMLLEALERDVEAVALLQQLYADLAGRERYVTGNALLHRLFELDRPQQALDLLDAAPDHLDPFFPFGDADWLWRRSMRAEVVGMLGRWDEAAEVVADALSRTSEHTDRQIVGDLLDLRARAALDTDLDLAGRCFQQACEAYSACGDEDGVQAMTLQLRCLSTLIASYGPEGRPVDWRERVL